MKVIKYFLGYTVFLGLIGLAISGLMSLGLLGCHTSCKSSVRGCDECFDGCRDGCEDCAKGFFGTAFGAFCMAVLEVV